MNLSIQDELQPFVEELQRYVTPVFLEELARNFFFEFSCPLIAFWKALRVTLSICNNHFWLHQQWHIIE
ncbi:hypothetical protein FOA24_27390 [Bacillus thuringiensis]|uniref:hypothetical protein n=1 Tax=Bacillus thuringiensis TaxID=1428 RepID=UPI00333E07A3